MQISNNGLTISVVAIDDANAKTGKMPDLSRAIEYVYDRMNAGFYIEAHTQEIKTEGVMVLYVNSFTLCGRDRYDAL